MTVTQRLDAEESSFLTRIMTLGAGTNLPVTMSPSELARLIGVIYFDTRLGHKLEEVKSYLWAAINPGNNYYLKPESWFLEPLAIPSQSHIELMLFWTTADSRLQDLSQVFE